MARFPNTSCSQCGCDLGPGDSGVSHCEDHAVLADGFDGSTFRPGPNHSTIEIWYDTEAQARAAHNLIRDLINDATPPVQVEQSTTLEPVAWIAERALADIKADPSDWMPAWGRKRKTYMVPVYATPPAAMALLVEAGEALDALILYDDSDDSDGIVFMQRYAEAVAKARAARARIDALLPPKEVA